MSARVKGADLIHQLGAFASAVELMTYHFKLGWSNAMLSCVGAPDCSSWMGIVSPGLTSVTLSVLCCLTLRAYVNVFFTMNRGAIVMTLVSLYYDLQL